MMQPAMNYLSGDELLAGLPLLLAGPMLRRTEPGEVTVWVALKQACRVTLKIFETYEQGEQLGKCIFRGERETEALGAHLHMVAVTARPYAEGSAAKLQALASDRLYAYDLEFSAEDRVWSLEEAYQLPHRAHERLSYFGHQKPTFVLPPQSIDTLKIAHGSCRKPHGRGFDALPILDSLLEDAACNPKERLHQLLLTGDQIYGDDVADPLLWLATPIGNTLLGWAEELPMAPRPSAPCSPASDSPAKAQPQQLAAGKRAEVATRWAGLTAGLHNKKPRVTSHLFSLGEYLAAYLLAYSPACWPESLPTGRRAIDSPWYDVLTVRRWNQDRRNMRQFLHSLWKVRRLLANVPTYTIFDDHDVSDDWNLNQEWCLRVLGSPLGRRTVQNALLAYALCQGWGNTPAQFEPGEPGAALMAAARRWSQSYGTDANAQNEISQYLGLPPANPYTGLPQLVEDGPTWILQRSAKALVWHYRLRSDCHEVFVLDSRTWRGYPIEAKPIDPPWLLCPTAFEQQLRGPLSQEPDRSERATFVVAPTNVFGMRVLDVIQKWQLDRGKVFSTDVGDSWNLNHRALATLLTDLLAHRQQVVVLSGDIHYSSAIEVEYCNHRSGRQARLSQLTSSAIKNEELLTQLLHTKLKQWLLPEKPREWVGWLSPPDMAERTQEGAIHLSDRQSHKDSYQLSHRPPDQESPLGADPTVNWEGDWHCQIRWLKRQRAETVKFAADLNALVPPRLKPQHPWVNWLKFWHVRWFQEGEEVVGVNNIALVHCQRFPEENNPDALQVTQEHYWFSPWAPTQVMRSRFR